MLLTDQISFSDCLYLTYYFLRAIFILDHQNEAQNNLHLKANAYIQFAWLQPIENCC